VFRVDPVSMETIECPGHRGWAPIGREVWVWPPRRPGPESEESPEHLDLLRVDAATLEEVGTVRVPGGRLETSLGPVGLWGLSGRVRLSDGPASRIEWSVSRIDPEAEEVVRPVDLSAVDVRRFLPPPPEPMEPGPVEEETRREVAGQLVGTDAYRTEFWSRTPLATAEFEEVRLIGTFPNTELAVLYRSPLRPGVLLGRRGRIWSDEGVFASYPIGAFLTDLKEGIAFGFPHDREPDESGVVWM
jgi:hypothetical protein